MKNPVLILALAVAGGAMALGLWSWQQWINNNAAATGNWATATVLPQGRQLPDVQLIDQDGKPFHPDYLQGHWSILFFGFTHCPDICPNTLALLRAINESRVAEQLAPLQMVFISVDPARDTAEKLRAYVHYFDPKMLGLTGTQATLKKLTGALYLPYQIGPPDEHGNYTVDHSASLVLLDPDGLVRAYFTTPLQLDAILSDLRKLIRT